MKAKKQTDLLLWVLLGFIIVEFFFLLRGTYKHISIQDLDSLKEEIEVQQLQNNALINQTEQLQNQLTSIYEKLDQGLSKEEVLKEELKTYREVSGLEGLEGEGVIVLVTDSEAPLYQDDDPNKLLVHDRDIQLLLSNLRNAGAEAISVNDQRVLFGWSHIYCNGPTIRINGSFYAQPFIIKAIGPRKSLQSAINSNRSHAFEMKQKGIFVEVNTSVALNIPAFDGMMQFNYVKEE